MPFSVLINILVLKHSNDETNVFHLNLMFVMKQQISWLHYRRFTSNLCVTAQSHTVTVLQYDRKMM